jgi:hypothetical protein
VNDDEFLKRLRRPEFEHRRPTPPPSAIYSDKAGASATAWMWWQSARVPFGASLSPALRCASYLLLEAIEVDRLGFCPWPR